MRTDRIPVLMKGVPVGVLERYPGGGRFIYDAAWLDSSRTTSRGIAYAMPPRSEPYEAGESGLPAFFVNLLPEGDLLRRLSRRAHLQADDLFGFLSLMGEDTVGDVYVDAPPSRRIQLDVSGKMTFADAYRSLLSDPQMPFPQDAVPGVQPKISASRLTLPAQFHAGPSAFLKLTTDERFPRAAENEHFFMRAAKACGLRVARTELVSDSSGATALLVHRFDRRVVAHRVVRLHQEDACQLLGLFPADKYRVSVEEIGDCIRRVTDAPIPACFDLLTQFAFGYLIGNHDQHAKNVSVLEGADGLWGLSPAYDMLCTAAYGDQGLALTLNGNDEELCREDFLALGRQLGIRDEALSARMDRLVSSYLPWLNRLPELGLDRLLTERLHGALRERADALAS